MSEMQSWAVEAGEILMARFNDSHKIRHKGKFDLVTEADTASEDSILRNIRSRYPDHTIITEESGLHQGSGGTWYIDPLDGTVNYAHGVPVFAVSMAYAESGQVQLGVVYDPTRKEMFAAERGQGAILNGEPIHVSEPEDLAHSLLVTGFPYELYTMNDSSNNLDNYGRFARQTQGVRRLGSAALDLVYVAAGRLDGYWELSIKAWDIAAGTLIVEEAGGKVTNLTGSPDYFQPPFAVVTACPRLHSQMIAVLLQPAA